MIRCLFIEDDYIDQMAIRRLVASEGLSWKIEIVSRVAEAKALLNNESFDAIVSDYNLPDGNAFDFLEMKLDVPVIIVTGAGSEQIAVNAMKSGASDYLIKDSDRNYLKMLPLTIDRTIKNRMIVDRMEEQIVRDSARISVTGKSASIQELCKLIDIAARSEAPVLITGETGTGKNLTAKAIHYSSQLNKGPFVCINCAALPESMIEAELFGYEKGAFTGAVAAKRGLFEMAEGGTVYLDEIGEMPMHLQSKLLSVIEDKRLRRLGGVVERDMEARIISSTNVDLAKALGISFRKDLYFRLGIMRIHIPPLRDRIEDIPELCHHLLKKLVKNEVELSASELTKLMNYNWPGNVRELRNVLERALMLHGRTDIRPSEFIGQFKQDEYQNNVMGSVSEKPLMTLDEVEKRHIMMALNRFSGNVTKTAEALGMSLATLKRRIREYGSS
ncbi:MAG TPA: sigma-54 dependent transcriptional regulator [Dissulfurispiraceae bacterium]|nr:sigma-54 dependent transcriptional regulator [Dissulfurispiraceae bacterium]